MDTGTHKILEACKAKARARQFADQLEMGRKFREKYGTRADVEAGVAEVLDRRKTWRPKTS